MPNIFNIYHRYYSMSCNWNKIYNKNMHPDQHGGIILREALKSIFIRFRCIRWSRWKTFSYPIAFARKKQLTKNPLAPKRQPILWKRHLLTLPISKIPWASHGVAPRDIILLYEKQSHSGHAQKFSFEPRWPYKDMF